MGESRGAVDDLAREVAARAGAVFGLHRFSVRQLAAQLAGPELARRGCAPGTGLNIEAIAARAAFEERRDGALGYLGEVARLRSFARTLAATLQDLRCSGVDPARVAGAGGAGGELAALAARYAAQLGQARLVDAPGVLRTAAAAAAAGAGPPCGIPLLLLDVAIHDDAVRALVAALAARAPSVLATVPAGDRRTRAALERLPGARVEEPGPADPAGSLDRVRRYLFTADAPPPPAAGPAGEAAGSAHTAAGRDAGDVTFFSAPGEGRECVEIARRILQESARGVRFDRMAVLVRAADVYAGHLETALSRAGVPAWFARGTRLPDPSGRALLALLACAAEGLSARRFSEYLSLAQVPAPAAAAPRRRARGAGRRPPTPTRCSPVRPCRRSRRCSTRRGPSRRRLRIPTNGPWSRARCARRGSGTACSWSPRSSAGWRAGGAASTGSRGSWRCAARNAPARIPIPRGCARSIATAAICAT